MRVFGVLCHLSAGGRAAPGGRPRCAQVGGPLAAPDGAGFLCTSADVRGVLSHSRERTKGRPVAANPRQYHGCPRTPRRLVWGRNLLLREAICFLAGAAWNSLGCYAARPLAAGRHRWAALAARGVVSLSRAYRAKRNRLETVRFSATPHGRRSRSSLRRPPQEVAASCPHGGARNSTRSGATVGEPRPSSTNPVPSPEGKVSRLLP